MSEVPLYPPLATTSSPHRRTRVRQGEQECAPCSLWNWSRYARISRQDVPHCLLSGVHHISLHASTRWSTTLSRKVNEHLVIDLRALCGEKLVTYHTDF